MAYREFFEKNQPFHIVSRAVEERKIFNDEADCDRFIFQIFAANLGKPAPNLWRRDTTKVAQALLQGEEIPSGFITIEHPPLVHILSFALVVNHYHLYLVPSIENIVPLFIKKLNIGFAKYFNLKNKRKGALFGSRYRSIPVRTEFQSDAVVRYINIINPLDVYQPGWREQGLKDWKGALNFLENYQYSSFPDLIGKRKSKILAPEDVLEQFSLKRGLISESAFRQFTEDFLRRRLKMPDGLFLE